MAGDDLRAELATSFDRHANEEGRILETYRELSERLGEDALGSLVSHILTEEELHHLLLRTMAGWLREPAGSRDMPPHTTDRPKLLALTRELRKHERETIDACHGLKSQIPESGGTVMRALLEAMALDSEKHDRLLGAVEAMLEG